MHATFRCDVNSSLVRRWQVVLLLESANKDNVSVGQSNVSRVLAVSHAQRSSAEHGSTSAECCDFTLRIFCMVEQKLGSLTSRSDVDLMQSR